MTTTLKKTSLEYAFASVFRNSGIMLQLYRGNCRCLGRWRHHYYYFGDHTIRSDWEAKGIAGIHRMSHLPRPFVAKALGTHAYFEGTPSGFVLWNGQLPSRLNEDGAEGVLALKLKVGGKRG